MPQDVPSTSDRRLIELENHVQTLDGCLSCSDTSHPSNKITNYDLALYDNESWNDPSDFTKPVKAIALPQDVSMNKITTLCEICSGPHGTQYCMEDSEQACVDYASSRTNEMGGKGFTLNQGPRSFNDSTNTWKDKPNFNWERTQTFTNPQNESISIYSSSYQLRLEKALLDFNSN
ncbi:hypothetical protein Tco_1007068 [Tanacetum coccineum]|uniref:MAK10-like protein n=1 Tax=Tanacetum coccineum TaxID=301880 RepID=A0ABQ5FJP8_9ASTR